VELQQALAGLDSSLDPKRAKRWASFDWEKMPLMYQLYFVPFSAVLSVQNSLSSIWLCVSHVVDLFFLRVS
jgi:hypothetical protein